MEYVGYAEPERLTEQKEDARNLTEIGLSDPVQLVASPRGASTVLEPLDESL